MFTVIEVIDGDTFMVSPEWKWNGKTGSVVRALGINTPERGQAGYDQATAMAKRLLDGQQVELKNPVSISYGRLVCEVWVNGRNIADYLMRYAA